MCVPFIHQGKIVGLIALGSKQPLIFSKTSLNLLTVMANHLASTVAQACRTDMLERFHTVEKEKFLQPIVGECEGIKYILRLISHVSKQSLSILITGETGTGKELVARSIHFQGLHPEGPFVSINCASIPVDVFEAELFGHEKGAFTGAYRTKPGKFELAQDGTLFFDEVGELPLPLQAKILRVLETQEFARLGGTRTLYTNARFLFATNKDLTQMVKEHRFREDLIYRINTFEIHVPPLRERLEDIPLLVDYFLDQIQGQMGKAQPFRYSPSLIGCLLSYHWPGNIRELRNLLEQMAILSETGYLEEDLLPERLRVGALSESAPAFPKKADGLLHRLTDKTQKQIILQALKESHGEKKRAAKILGISRPTLDKRLQQYGIFFSERESQNPEARGNAKKII
jgi:transcriptional regulator with GAF, ATPase, and Fis domain